MSLSTRAEVRQAFAALVETALDGVAVTYDHYRRDLQGASPVVVVAAAGTDPQRLTARGGRATYFIDVFCFVLRGRSEAYSEADSDDLLDQLDHLLQGVVFGNQVADGLWKHVAYRDASTIETLAMGGEQYSMERHALRFEVY